MKLLLTLALLATPLFAVLEIGDAVPKDMCWTDRFEQKLCLSDIHGAVVVLVYNTGWCPGCNDEMAEMSRRFSEMKGKPAVFFSLSSEGYGKGAPPDKDFLNDWQKKHSIPFMVAASPKDAGKSFFKPPYYIPSLVIIDKEGKLAFKEVEPAVTKVFEEVNRLAAIPVR